MGEILGTLWIALAVIAYAASARALGCELRALSERRVGGKADLRQDDDLDAELIARDLYLRHLEDLGAIDLGGIEGFGS